MSNYNSKVNTLLRYLSIFCALALHTCFYAAFAQTLEIWEIQGDALESPFQGQVVTTADNIVTGVGDDFFFIQTPPERSDDNPSTSDGLFIYTGSFPNVELGDVVTVTGFCTEFSELTELTGSFLNFTITASDAPLPPPVVLSAQFPSPDQVELPDLETVEGMRVSFEAEVIAPSGNNELAALTTADARPFREAGITFPGLNDLPVFDGNPEIFWIDPDALNQPNNRFISVGQSVSGTGPLFQNDSRYEVFPTAYTVTGQRLETDLPPAASDEITIGCINVLQLRDESELLDIQFPKIATYIVDRLGAPDIIALQEVGDLGILQELVFSIDQIAPELDYIPYLINGNNNTPINVGYLVKPRIQDVNVTQLGQSQNLSLGGRLHDRPPLLLEANLPTEPATPITVLNLHLRSLNGIEGSDAFFVRTKRHEQAISVANMIQARQDQNLFVVGDFNALPFSDGYVDVLSQLSGTASEGALFSPLNIVNPPLFNHAFEQTSDERYSFVFRGSAQLIDHCLSTQLTGISVSDFAFARGNADAASPYYLNPNITTRSSDHDGFVLYLQPEAPIVSSTNNITQQAAWSIPNPVIRHSLLSVFQAPSNARWTWYDATGRQLSPTNTLQAPAQAGTYTLYELTTGTYQIIVVQ